MIAIPADMPVHITVRDVDYYFAAEDWRAEYNGILDQIIGEHYEEEQT